MEHSRVARNMARGRDRNTGRGGTDHAKPENHVSLSLAAA